MHRYRFFLLLALVLMGCKRQPSSTVFLDPALATLVPADTVFLAGVRMEQLQKTAVYQDYIRQRKLPMLDQFAKETGVDPRKDLWEVLIASDGKTSVVLLRGKFSEMGLEPRLNRPDVQRFTHKGVNILGDERTGVAFLSPTTAIAGPTAAVRNVIDRRNETTGIPARLQQAINSIPSSNQLWFAGDVAWRLPAASDSTGPFAAIAPLLQEIESMSGGADLRSGIDAAVIARMRKDESAQRLGEAVRGLVGFGRLQTPSNRPELLRVYDGIQATAEERVLRLSLKLDQDGTNELMRLAETLTPGRQ